jgi:formylglycine-generating enzyme required for sulfatase activity
MLGNVLVWTEDCWQPDYMASPGDGSARVAVDCRDHEVRGASWFTSPAAVTASYRNHFPTDHRASSVGFRLVRDME